MLEKLLEEIRKGGTLDTAKLADHLGTRPQMIIVMLEQLERMGLLTPLANCPSEECKKCGEAGSCQLTQQPARIWQSLR